MKTDADLKQEVRAALQSEPGLEAGGLNVTVVDGIVTLAGSVPVCAQKFRAEAVAKAVRGVRAVVDDIGVCRPDGGRPSDADIAAAVLHAIKWDTDVPEDLIRVIVRDGWITLEGTVDSAFQREAADRVVRRVLELVASRLASQSGRGVVGIVALLPAVGQDEKMWNCELVTHGWLPVGSTAMLTAPPGWRTQLIPFQR